jgi:hypothetical protein
MTFPSTVGCISQIGAIITQLVLAKAWTFVQATDRAEYQISGTSCLVGKKS